MKDDGNARLDPEWKTWPDGVVSGAGQQTHFRIFGDDRRGYVVWLTFTSDFGVTGTVHVSRSFPSLPSAKRWCERYFG